MATLGRVRAAKLEQWLRVRYFDTRIDISSSGVQPYRLDEVRALTGMALDDLDRLVFRDSPSTGHERLRQALVDRFEPGSKHAPVACHGSTEAILLAVSALLSPGDEVVVTSASYHALSALAEAAGAKLVWWELDPGADRPDLDRLRTLIGPLTKAVVVNFPHNPTGLTLTADEYAELLSIVERSGAYLLWDAAFGELVYDGPALPDPSTQIDRCFSFGTLSKSYGLPGLRVGWCIAPLGMISKMVSIRDHVTLSTSPLLEEIASRVLENADAVLSPRLEQARSNLNTVSRWLGTNRDVLSGVIPRGGVTLFPQVVGLSDTRPLCEELAADHGVLTIPGDCFGHAGRIRLGFGGPANELDSALDVLAEVIKQRSGRRGGATRSTALGRRL